MGYVDDIISYYNTSIEDMRAAENPQKVRINKNKLVVKLAERMVTSAWYELKREPRDFKIRSDKIKFNIQGEYLDRLPEKINSEIKNNLYRYYYKLKIDVPVFYKNKLRLAIECKAYTENAMLKRVLFNADITKKQEPEAKTILFQLESQMGGDYSDINKPLHFGGYSNHALMSYFPAVKLHIVTLLEGERNIKQPIHKEKYFKPLTEKSVERAVAFFKSIIKENL